MNISDVILTFRAKNALSQREFARRCGLSNSLISLLEMGYNPQTGKKISPDLDTYSKIAKGMCITLHELFEMLDDSETVSLLPKPIARAPKTAEARSLAYGVDKMPKEQREMVMNMVKAVFAKYFTQEGTNDDEA